MGDMADELEDRALAEEMDMPTPLIDPRPAATEAATMLQAALDDVAAFNALYGETLTAQGLIDALANRGLTIAAAPPAGQVCISEQTRQTALAVLTERANDYIDAQELTPHYGTTATIGTPWDSAIAELAALKGATR